MDADKMDHCFDGGKRTRMMNDAAAHLSCLSNATVLKHNHYFCRFSLKTHFIRFYREGMVASLFRKDPWTFTMPLTNLRFIWRKFYTHSSSFSNKQNIWIIFAFVTLSFIIELQIHILTVMCILAEPKHILKENLKISLNGFSVRYRLILWDLFLLDTYRKAADAWKV